MKKVFLTLIALLSVQLAIGQNCNVTFTAAVSQTTPLQVTVTNTTTWNLVPGSTPMMWVYWGDSGSDILPYTTNSTVSHNYTNPGIYNIAVLGIYYDSLNNTMLCIDSSFQQVTITSPCMSSISTADNGGGSYTFTANNIGGGSGISYTWDFGDGNTGTGTPVNHTYATSGNYTVTLVSNGGGCTHTSTANVYYFSGTINCTNLTAGFSIAGSGASRSFMNTSTPVMNTPAPIARRAIWNFGDGSPVYTTFSASTSHTYSATGTYSVLLINQWVDSNTQTVYCTDSLTQQVTISVIPPPVNEISGNIYWDSLQVNLQQVHFKVWLIVMDSVQNTLTAVDSALTSGWSFAPYIFQNIPAGSYRTKAAVVSGSPGANQLIPTYHLSSAFWNSATVIHHTGGSSSNNNIWMIPGTPTSGPGFIGGSISLGANKGSSNGISNLLVMLRNSQGDIVRFTYTDGNGDYSFGNIPAGSFTVYPENMNYITVPSAPVTIASGQYNVNGVNFKHTPTHIMPIATSVGNVTDEPFRIFPNPSQGLITIQWSSDITETANIQVSDVTGRILLSTETAAAGTAKLDLQHLQSGIYFIKIVSGTLQHTQNVLINH